MTKNIIIAILVIFSIVLAIFAFIQMSLAEKNLELAVSNEKLANEVAIERYKIREELEKCRAKK